MNRAMEIYIKHISKSNLNDGVYSGSIRRRLKAVLDSSSW